MSARLISKRTCGARCGLKRYLVKRKGIELGDKELKKFYEENKERFTKQEEVKASHILIKVDAEAQKEDVDTARQKAEAIAKEAQKKNADFAALAREKSEGPTANVGGDLGFFTRDRMVPEFSEAAFKMKPGEVSDPVRHQVRLARDQDRREEGQRDHTL